jgi:protein subunit release factor A
MIGGSLKMKDILFRVTKEDMNITYFSGKGGGGQHRNRHMNCVRLNHKDSGVMVTGQSNKEKQSNIKEALQNLVKHPKFKIWHNKRTWEELNKVSIDEIVDKMMVESNLKIEEQVDEKWVKI